MKIKTKNFGIMPVSVKMETEEHLSINKLYAMLTGTEILKAGCFHDADIYAADEGKSVTVLDSSICRINAASGQLPIGRLQNNLSLIHADFLRYDFGEKRFDTVVIADYLQTILFPGQWICKAFSLLKENGVFLATVPFGFHPVSGTKATYFLLDFLELAEAFGPVEDYGIWEGATAYLKAVKKKDYAGMLLDLRDVLGKSEKAFLEREKKYVQNCIKIKQRFLSDKTKKA